MILNDFSYVSLTIFDEKIIVQWEHLAHEVTFDEGI